MKKKNEKATEEKIELKEDDTAQVTGGVNICSSYGGIEIPVVATDKKGDIIVFKIDAPAEEEDDVVNLDIAPVIHKGEVLIPAEIEAEKDTSGLF